MTTIGEIVRESLEDLETMVDRAVGSPFDDPDDRRKWELAWEVSRGPASAVHTMVCLERARNSHRLHEGLEIDMSDWEWSPEGER